MKLFTLDDRLIERRAGALGAEDAAGVRAALSRALGVATDPTAAVLAPDAD